MQHSNRGFSLVEILIVVVILGILAALAIPQFTGASNQTRDTAAKTTLQYIRGQLELFKSQHANVPPQEGYLWALLQQRSDTAETNLTNPTGTAEGPYIVGTPLNPWSGRSGATSVGVDTTSGWYYTADTSSYEFRIRNVDGSVNYSY